MPKIDIETAPKGGGSRYPAPFNEPCLDRRWTGLADAVGLTQFGVNRVVLPPGVWSSQRHWHEIEDEFVWVLEGEPTLVTDAGEEVMKPGECAGFKAGVRDGHVFKNLTDKDVVLLVIGGRDDADHGEYSDIDMRFKPGRYSGNGGYEHKDGTPY